MDLEKLAEKLTIDIQNKYGEIFDMNYKSEEIYFYEIDHDDVYSFIKYMEDNTNIFQNKDIKLRTENYEILIDDEGNHSDSPYTEIKNIGKLSEEEIKLLFKYLDEYLESN